MRFQIAKLHKVCRQLKVPTPQAGYWAKKAAGKKLPPQPKLPAYDGAAVFYQDPEQKARQHALSAPPPEPDELAQYRLREERPSAKIEVSETLRHPLPIVSETKRELLGRTYSSDPRGFLHSAGGKWLALAASKETLDRALRIYDALLKALKSRGLSLDEKGSHDYRDTHILVLGEKISIALKERSTRSDYQPTEEELKEARRRGYQSFPKWRYSSTGELRFQIGKGQTAIGDNGSRKLEAQLNDVIVALFSEALKQKEWEKRRQEEEKKWQARAAEIYRQKELVGSERAKLKALEDEASAWHRAERLRAYLAAMKIAIANGALTATAEVQDKISWGYHKADWLDPIVSAEDPILDLKIDPWY